MKPVFKIDIYAGDIANNPNRLKVRGKTVVSRYDADGQPVVHERSDDGAEDMDMSTIPDPVKTYIQTHIKNGGNANKKISGIDEIYIVRHHGSPGCVTMFINGQMITKCW